MSVSPDQRFLRQCELEGGKHWYFCVEHFIKTSSMIETQIAFRTHLNIHRNFTINWFQGGWRTSGAQQHQDQGPVHHCQQKPPTVLTKLGCTRKPQKLSARKHAIYVDTSGDFSKLQCYLWVTKRLMIWRTRSDKILRWFFLKRCVKCERKMLLLWWQQDKKWQAKIQKENSVGCTREGKDERK